jgi:hypothetical protein
MSPGELVGNRVRIWLAGTRGVGRTIEGIVNGGLDGYPYPYSIPAADGRVPFAVDEARVLDVWADDEALLGWHPVFNGRTPHKKRTETAPPKKRKTNCSNCGKKGHDRRMCPSPLEK